MLIALAVPTGAAAQAPRLLDDRQLSPRLHELTFQTSALAAPTRVRVLLPADYATQR